MSFSKFKIGELRQIAEGFGVEVAPKTSKEDLILLLEEEGISYDMYEKFLNAEKEDVEEPEVEEPEEIVPFVDPFEFPVTVPMPTTPLIVAVFFTKTRKPFVNKTLPSGIVRLL